MIEIRNRGIYEMANMEVDRRPDLTKEGFSTDQELVIDEVLIPSYIEKCSALGIPVIIPPYQNEDYKGEKLGDKKRRVIVDTDPNELQDAIKAVRDSLGFQTTSTSWG